MSTYCTSSGALNSTKPYEDGSSARGVGEYLCTCVLANARVERLEVSKSTRTASMNYALRNTFMIKAMDLLSSYLILKKHRTDRLAVRHFEPVVCVGYGYAMVRGDARSRVL